MLLVGEHSEPTLVSAYLELLNRCGVPVMSSTNSGPKEVGSPITAQMLTPHARQERKTSVRNHMPPHIKHGSTDKRMLGDIRVMNEQDREVEGVDG